jgi:hypothetical protein
MTFASAQPRDEMEDLLVPFLVKLGGSASMVAGIFTVGLAVQTASLFQMRGILPGVFGGMAVLGTTSVIAGWGTTRGRSTSAIVAAAATGLIATLGAVWAFVGLFSGLVSPLSFLIIPLGTIAAVFSALSIGPARRVTIARANLRAQGFDFGT